MKEGNMLESNRNLLKMNKSKQARETVRLNKGQRQVVKEAIKKEAEKLGQRIYSIGVCSNHVHIVVDYVRRPV